MLKSELLEQIADGESVWYEGPEIARDLEDVFWIEGTDGKCTARKECGRARAPALLASREIRAEESAQDARCQRAAKKSRKGKANA